MRHLRYWTATALLCVTGFAQADLSERQSKLLHNVCLHCHVRADTGAPLIGNTEEWRERLSNGETVMLRNVVQGLRGMPPLGSCSACDEADLRALTRAISKWKGGK
jgi:cytochrome c5